MTKQSSPFYNDVMEKSRHMERELNNSILTAYFLVMMVVYPLYIQDGYREIGNVKYYFFRNVSLVVVGIILLILAVGIIGNFILHRHEQKKVMAIIAHYRNLSMTDWFVYGYLLAVLLSYLFTAFRKEAFWGADGWYMGLVSQLLFISIYFLFSRYFRWNEKMLYVMLFGSGFVFLLGILNRYSIYPIVMNGQTPTFISTLGNINWFCGYWAVICPFGIMCYWKSRGGWQQMAAGIYVIIGFISGVTQGSSSAYLALTGVFILLFSLSFEDNQSMCRFLEICMLFTLSCQIARLLRFLPGFMINYEKDLGILLTDTNITLYLGVIAGIFYLLFYYLTKRKNYQIEQYKRIRQIVLMLLIVLLIGYVILLIANTCLSGGLPGLSGIGFLTFNNTWANSRGATWTSGILAYWNMSPFQKLIGVGPDCFAEYIYKVPELAERVYAQFGNARLTNAHNEWITLLVNTGALGLACYAGFFISAFIRFLKGARIQPVLYLCAASILAYTIHNIVSFQQILNTPFVFLLSGIGEGLLRFGKETVDK